MQIQYLHICIIFNVFVVLVVLVVVCCSCYLQCLKLELEIESDLFAIHEIWYLYLICYVCVLLADLAGKQAE